MHSNTFFTPLDEDERAAAFSLWESLMFAPTRACLEAARHCLKCSPEAVQQAVMNAIVSEWAQNKNTPREENPFAPMPLALPVAA